MSHFKNRLLPVAALALMSALSTSASAENSGFMALFEEPADSQDYSASYDGGQQPASYEQQQDDTRLQRESSNVTREIVSDPTNERPGTITVDTEGRYLYLSLANGQAMRYGIGVGREGFTWKGRVHIGRKEAWPAWTPPKEMLKRRPDLPRHMAGGEENPLGARAMYLYSGGKDTMFRIHGSNEPWTIGQAVSSGCIRMTNDDVTDLFSRVKVGTTVVVL
ncbi:L,D-transpeptidase [Methylocystis parvus]|uniref:L,D-transpeptidase n=1 Tax=Methylocystis parvus TaxID=134 RepID=UPI003C7811C5